MSLCIGRFLSTLIQYNQYAIKAHFEMAYPGPQRSSRGGRESSLGSFYRGINSICESSALMA